MSIIINYVRDMLPYVCVALPIVAVIRVIRIQQMKRRHIQTTLFHECAIIFLACFLVALASQTILEQSEFGSGATMLEDPIVGSLNLIPFRVIRDTYLAIVEEHNYYALLINFMGNIIMFMPIGFFPALLLRKVSLRRAALLGLGTSLFIEICQLPLPRSTDIDDLWLNTLGAVMGFGVYVYLRNRYPLLLEKFKVIGRQDLLKDE